MNKIKQFILAALTVMMSATGFAADADFPARPDTAIFVNDFAAVLNSAQVKAMDDTLRAFSKRTTNQIMVVTVKDLGNYDPKAYAAELGDRWGVGKAKLDNGVIVLIKPKNGTSKGQFVICPGRGLGGALPDATCKRIVDSKAIPELKKGNYDAAVWAVIGELKRKCEGEISADAASGSSDNSLLWLGGIFVAVVGAVAVASRRAKKKQAIIEANETPEERAKRLAEAERKRKERETDAAAAAAVRAAREPFERQKREERRKRDNAEKFGGGTFDGGGAGSEW